MDQHSQELYDTIRSTSPSDEQKYLLIKTLLESGADPNYYHIENAKSTLTPFYEAILQSASYLVNGKYDTDYPLYYQFHKKIMDLLYNHGGDPNAKDITKKGVRPILSAIMEYGSHEFNDIVIKTLLDYGANPNAKITKEYQYQTRAYGRKAIRYTSGMTPLIMLAMIIEDQISRSSKSDAAKNQDLATLKLLLEHGANPNIKDDDGYTALDYLDKTKDEFPEFVKILEQARRHRRIMKKVLNVTKMQSSLRETMERPGGYRDRARRATNIHFSTDIKNMEALCNDLDNMLYKLYSLANEIGLVVTKKTSKGDLCRLLAEYGAHPLSY